MSQSPPVDRLKRPVTWSLRYRVALLGPTLLAMVTACGLPADQTDTTVSPSRLEPVSTTFQTTTTTRVTTTTSEPTTTSASETVVLPAEATHLDFNMWAVYVFVWEEIQPGEPPFENTEGFPLWEEVSERAAELGYEVTSWAGDLDCDPGAKQMLELDAERRYTATALYFDDEDDARIVAAAFEPFTVGYGYVGIGCNDGYEEPQSVVEGMPTQVTDGVPTFSDAGLGLPDAETTGELEVSKRISTWCVWLTHADGTRRAVRMLDQLVDVTTDMLVFEGRELATGDVVSLAGGTYEDAHPCAEPGDDRVFFATGLLSDP